jgi:L-gulonolactone oxidase
VRPAYTREPRFRSFGGAVRRAQQVAYPRFADQLPDLIRRAPGDRALAVGLSRSYGDSAMNSAGGLINMTGLDRILEFDPGARRIRAQAGLSLDALMRFLAPKGLFTATSPGTAQVTLGGAVANDVHGKNHHSAGSFGCAVRRLKLLRSTGEALELAPGDPLFEATVGGLGLTGVIEWVELDLVAIPGAWMSAEDIPFGSLDEFFRLAEESAESWEHTAAWIDVRRGGRGLFSRSVWTDGPPLGPRGGRLSAPFEPPVSLLGPLTLQAMSEIYYRAKAFRGRRTYRAPYTALLHPLDAIGHWNRMYGPQGLWQHQSVAPPHAARDAVAALLRTVAEHGEGSFMVVLKTFGPRPSPGLMSFPMPGATLAMDFAAHGEAVLRLMDRLDDIVRSAGGRLYAAKDGRARAEAFRSGYPRLEEFVRHLDPGLSSDFQRRVLNP